MKEEMGVAPSFIATAPTYVWSSRVEDRRGMDWFYTLTLAYRIEGLDLHEYVASEESTELRFFSKEDLNELSLNTQMEPLRSFFDPKDFV
ncbi:MAG: hypothetical protein JO026_02280 [Patescibacteria group bacterium]|nr:hypothetical protein [Patescibacteria group bacterium]